MAKVVNSFSAGMDQDSSKNKYDDRHYYAANNVRMFTQDGVTSGALEDMEGTLQRLNVDSGGNLYTIGHCIVRDDIILFTTRNSVSTLPPGAYDCYILKIPIADIEALTGTNDLTVSLNYVHDQGTPGNLIYTGLLGFSIANPIQAVGRHETESIQKVYWVDGYNNFRYLNIVYDADTNDLENLPIDRLEVLGDIDLSQPVYDGLVGGNLRSGRIQYAYQLYALNGGETVFSPFSNLVNLTDAPTSGNTETFTGSDIDVNTGRGVQVEINITSQYYSRIRVVAVHWSTLHGDPEVRIVTERQINPAGGIITVIDTGESLGSYTLEEVRLLETTLFSGGILETKNNILFAGNVTVDNFDVDFDARAYRFRGASSTPTDYNYDGGYTARESEIHIADGSAFWYHIDGTVSPPDVEDYLGNPIGDWTDIPEDFDAWNWYNRLGQDGSPASRFIFQTDGATIGGEGPNISYEIKIDDTDMYIQEEPADNAYRMYIEAPFEAYADIETCADRVGYHRAEVYRFGIIFFDSKGRSSFVKWIADIKMPSISTLYSNVATDNFRFCYETSVNRTRARIVYVEFTIDNMPAEAESFQIVRIARESGDRSILGQGLIKEIYGSGTIYHQGWREAVTGRSNYHFMSPEVAFNKNLIAQDNDYLQVIGTAGDYVDGTLAGILLDVTRYVDYDPLINPQTAESITPGNEHNDNNSTEFDDSKIIEQDMISVILDGVHTYTINNATNNTDKGISFIFTASNISWEANNINYDAGIKLVNYRRNVDYSQYGGPTYNSRAVNEYIAVGPIEHKTGSPVVSSVYGGDTYIGFFDCLYNSHENGVSKGAVDANAIYFPVESSINMEFRQGTVYHREYTNSDSSFIRDLAGVYADDDLEAGLPTIIYYQEEDYYRYNTAYSKGNTSKIFIPKPFDWESQVEFDVRVHASDLKINGELSDSWLKFRTDSFIEVDPQFGPLTAMKTVTERLCFFQPQAFGVISVNERALLQTQDISQLSLGQSGVLERYDYAKTDVGCSHWRQMVLTPDALYWVDAIKQSMYKFTKGPEEVSLMKGMDSWFRDNLTERKDLVYTLGETTHMFHDPEYKEVYLVDDVNQVGLIFNELTDGFMTFTDVQPEYVINYLEKVLGSTNLRQFHRHNDFASERGLIYGSYREISLTLLINPAKDDVSIFNNFEWFTEAWTSGVDQRETWDTLDMWNDYQSTTPISLVVGDNVKRRMRKWRYTIPRSAELPNGNPQPDGERYARMRDTHMFAKFSYTGAVDKRFVAHDIITSVTISNN